MQMLAATRREEICTGRYLKALKNQNGEHLVNLHIYMNQATFIH